MGKLINGPFGPLVGKVGGTVSFMWKGINAVRSYVIPANPNTASQQANRSVWASLVTMAKSILTSIIQVYWDPYATGMSGFNEFMSVNKSATGSTIDYSSLKVAQGNLEGAAISGAVYATGDVTASFSSATSGNGLNSDYCAIVVYDKTNQVAFVDTDTAVRDDGTAAVTVGSGRTVGDLQTYIFFYRGTGDALEVSNSSYFQTTT